jgi:hypothetical protein
MDAVTAYSVPEKAEPGRPRQHDHVALPMLLVKAVLGPSFSIPKANFLSSKMENHPAFAEYNFGEDGLTTPKKTIRNRAKLIPVHNAYYTGAKLPVQPKPKVGKRDPTLTWDSVDPEREDWSTVSTIIAKIATAIEAIFAKRGVTFNAREMAAKAIALWNSTAADEFAQLAECKKSEKKKGLVDEKSDADTEATPRCKKRQRTNPRPSRTVNQNEGPLSTPRTARTPAVRAIPFASVDAVAPAAPARAPNPAAELPMAPLSNNLYGFYRYQAMNSIPRLSYEERRAIVHHAPPTPVVPEADGEQAEVFTLPTFEAEHDTERLSFDDIMSAEIVN